MGLWRSDRPYADVPVAALEPDVGRLVELLATEDLWAAEIMLGRHGGAVPQLRRLVADHPLRERLSELLVVALYRSGNQGEALGVLRVARWRLADELGIDPGPALRMLEHDVLRHAPHLAPPRRCRCHGWPRPRRCRDRAYRWRFPHLLAQLLDQAPDPRLQPRHTNPATTPPRGPRRRST